MMTTKHILPLLIAGSAMFAGCKKEFLEAEPTQFTTPEQLGQAVAQDPTLLTGSITGLYTTMFNDGVGGTTNHDDFGQKGIDIYSDMLSSDMVLGATNYGWYENLVKYEATENFTRLENYIPWRYFYRQIFGANGVIDVAGGTNTEPAAGAKVAMGQAKAMRAYAYFYLSQLYATEYGTGTEKILPIYTSAAATEVNKPKATAKEVWDLMEKDLTQAITYLEGYTRPAGTKDAVDKNVAKGLLAYVLGARGTQADWQKVADLTKDIMAAYPVTDSLEAVGRLGGANMRTVLNPQSGFNNVKTPSWMWGVDLTLAQGIDLLSFWGQVDLFTYSYAWAGDPKTIDKGLYDAIRTDDIRKGQFDPPGGGLEPFYAASGYVSGDFDYMPLNKFFDPGRIDGGQRQVVTDLHYMRADEFYLLNAEANARLGKDAEAKASLKKLLEKRIKDISYIDALSGQALINEIYLQTRIELWGEGKSYLAMKRNKATVTRGDNHLFLEGQSFKYNDDQLAFEIPQAEVLNNPNLNK